ncbi:MAG: hypothetical protein IT298_14585 [Chloroflexi bacterium]|jgi:hypothetical protein|nr:MAG: hypothetical protein UZ13_00274 [Chloroflexi bacterium OLB13]MBC6957508.1 hypothetical protein [Chloroflexota bacterium]MBV6437752.1 hypothetical protein [Anaerolineae bacterium]MDL1917236.1 hypothetical protein [Anaerolineae bacterium CFX4]OQY82608.1 MAG: hypothetical protein B6D42_09060 [Anaerolineae bacterium UTCFX5]
MDNYIVSGDQAIFLPNFGSAVITPIPGVIVGSAVKTTVTGKPVCLEGDEKKVVVPGVAYINASYSIPGVGVLTIQALGGDQTSKKTTIEGKAPILKGTQFDAKFTVSTPAQMPTPGGTVPDSVPMFMGKGMFIPTNMMVQDGG